MVSLFIAFVAELVCTLNISLLISVNARHWNHPISLVAADVNSKPVSYIISADSYLHLNSEHEKWDDGGRKRQRRLLQFNGEIVTIPHYGRIYVQFFCFQWFGGTF